MALTTLIKPVGAACNLRCKYCFYRLDEHGTYRMSYDDIELLLTKIFEYERKEVYITFQGGEPTLAGIDFYRYFSQALDRLQGDRLVHIGFQTNGVLIDSDFARWFRENNVLVGVSLDGDRFINDKSRLDSRGKSSFASVMSGIRQLEKYGVDYNILSVISRDIASNVDRVLKFFDKQGFKYLQFTFPVREEYNSGMLPSSEEMYTFLVRSFDWYYRHIMDGKYISVRYFDNLINILLTGRCEQCGMDGKCGVYLLIDGDMRCYPCDFYVTEEYMLGNIREDNVQSMLSSEAMSCFISRTHLHSDCAGCSEYALCRGGCPRYYTAGKHEYCESIRRFLVDRRERIYKIAEHTLRGKVR